MEFWSPFLKSDRAEVLQRVISSVPTRHAYWNAKCGAVSYLVHRTLSGWHCDVASQRNGLLKRRLSSLLLPPPTFIPPSAQNFANSTSYLRLTIDIFALRRSFSISILKKILCDFMQYFVKIKNDPCSCTNCTTPRMLNLKKMRKERNKKEKKILCGIRKNAKF